MRQILVLICLAIVVEGQNECYHAWNIRTSSGCKSDADCAEHPGSNCIFSLVANARICCGPRPGAILPVCPPGKKLPPFRSSSGIVCGGIDDEDGCPYPYKCTESVSKFDKLPGQTNFVCCL